MSRPTILLAGASGAIGMRVLKLMADAGQGVRALARREASRARIARMATDVVIGDATNPATVRGLCDGVEIVVSCLGAPLALSLAGRAGYSSVDVTANGLLIGEARRAGVRRIVYAGLHVEPGYAHTRYAAAHERVAAMLRESGMEYTIVRPTGLFTAFADVMAMVRKWPVPVVTVIGDGSARTNPVHPQDVAEAMSAALEAGPAEIALGGPETFTRREIALLIGQMPFGGRTPWTPRMPLGVALGLAAAMRVAHPRLGELMEFIARVSTTDCIAPTAGTRRLGDYLVRRQQAADD